MPVLNICDRQVNCPEEVPRIEFWYPRNEGNASAIEVGLMDVRAADSIRVEYDFDRDGWMIKQATVFQWPEGEKVYDQGWIEVAFVPAWASQKTPPRDDLHQSP